MKAVATTSWATAALLGIQDEELTPEQNLTALSELAPIAREASIPISTDLRDGFDDPRQVTADAFGVGASGANIEDSIPSVNFAGGVDEALYPLDEQLRRLKSALSAVPEDFVLNARCDVFRLQPPPKDDDEEAMQEAIKRGKAYLEAGATTVFYWGGARGLRTSEVKRLVKELDGRVAVLLRAGGLTTAELAEIGVARISIGPHLYRLAMRTVRDKAAKIIGGGGLSV